MAIRKWWIMNYSKNDLIDYLSYKKDNIFNYDEVASDIFERFKLYNARSNYNSETKNIIIEQFKNILQSNEFNNPNDLFQKMQSIMVAESFRKPSLTTNTTSSSTKEDVVINNNTDTSSTLDDTSQNISNDDNPEAINI